MAEECRTQAGEWGQGGRRKEREEEEDREDKEGREGMGGHFNFFFPVSCEPCIYVLSLGPSHH